ncbi:SRPBCC family protein [Falsirhodobacter sp. alg1]|uniref:SRPBCC family protein n=1 Tax=Falsirhodobacter sp. alg1 TaxID=1472418 RepID=UPI0005F02637|nr:SRPBCC family protein [Falsirhodobacter sp. alg1]
MKFTSKGDMIAPPSFVFAKMSDFEGWEAAVRKRNTTVTRSPGPIDVGTVWDTRFRLRGRVRDMKVTLVDVQPERQIHLTIADPSLNVDILLDLVALAGDKSRLVTTIELQPRNLTARLLIQSLRLARAKIQGQLDQRIHRFAADTTEQYRVMRQAGVV